MKKIPTLFDLYKLIIGNPKKNQTTQASQKAEFTALNHILIDDMKKNTSTNDSLKKTKKHNS
jgi:hypothetical protein